MTSIKLPFKAVVTGGAGFIGSHLVDALVEKGCSVVVLDDLSTGNISNIASLVHEKKVRFVEGSVTDVGLLENVFYRADVVFHQAAIPSVPRSILYPLVTHAVNSTGTLNVLHAAKEEGVKKVIYASSSSVYGNLPSLPKREAVIARPLSPYAVSKLAGEQYCVVFNKVYGFATASLRYFNVYGPRQDPNSKYAAVIPLFISALMKGKPPTIYGKGDQTRDFTFVEDVVRANILAATSEATGVFNIGSGQRTSINDLALLIAKLCNNPTVKPIYEEPRSGDIKHSLADISKAETFGYKPKFSLEYGLKSTIKGSNE